MEPLFLNLPTEILLEITAYYHNTPLPYERYRRPTGDAILLGRFDMLRSLSQTCRTFRSIFLYLVWEHVEALDIPSDTTGRHINLLKRRMTGILKTPSLPRFVRTVLVSLRLSAPNWNLITVFARFLQATPNLSALHIVEIYDRHAGILAGRLAGQYFPSVQTLTIPSSLSRAVSSFPNLRTLICGDSFVSDYDALALLKESSKHCPSLQSLANFTPSTSVIKGLLKHFPHVKELRFRHVATSDILNLLGALENLCSIEFPHRHRGERLEHIREAAERIFRTPVSVEYAPPEADVGDLVVKMRKVPL
ncbi:hypothetical protein DFH07DRAFT_835141 [Mycena maculata]|uniref:Uncharacterized protein n=1 Tax=Mycena maculata TaxID=230809 RepID=A0AAD7IL02_9AGAR|nr:hypothetical protein DFH07DRAFT_835141 [Mycena maculata]